MAKISGHPSLKKTEPPLDSEDWIIWAAWADRITFEEIKSKTGMSEGQVVKVMRKILKPNSFKLWHARASNQSHKHRKLFQRTKENYLQAQAHFTQV
jgi:uncharacterized protein (TIGR03643 family)